MGSPRQIVLLCAEEDDLALVGAVHLGRQLGLQLQVITELECDDGPFLDAINGCDRGLFAIVRSPHLDAKRAGQLTATFQIARIEGLELVELTLDESPDETLRPALALLSDLDDWDPPRLGTDLPTGRFTPAVLPTLARSGLGPVLPTDPAFEREANTSTGHDLESTGRLDAFPLPVPGADLEVPTRSRGGAIALSVACVALLAAGAWWQWQQHSTAPEPAKPNTAVRVVEAAAVPADEDDVQPAEVAADPPPQVPATAADTAAADHSSQERRRKRRKRRRR